MRGAFDFETAEWKPFFCSFAWDGGRETDFLMDSSVSTPKKVIHATLIKLWKMEHVKEWWAHNAGKFEDLFLREAVADMGWEIQAQMAGSRPVRFQFRPEGAKRWALILDSFALVQSPLKKIAVDFELPSRKQLTEEDYETLGSIEATRRLLAHPDRRNAFIQRSVTDSKLVLELLDKVEGMFVEWGGKVKATFSSSALSLVKADLAARGEKLPKLDPLENKWARGGYYGGRVDVLHHAPQWDIVELDLNSSYPWSMSQALPFRGAKWADNGAALRAVMAGQYEGIVKARVTVPQSMHIPPLPYRDRAGSMFFPTGTWEARFPACELRYAMGLGVKVEPIEALAFDTDKPFAAFIERLYGLKSQSTGAVRNFAKLALNGCYGKFAERPEKELLHVFPSEGHALDFLLELKAKARAKRRPMPKVRPLAEGDERFQLQETFFWPPHTHYPLASYVTGYSRILLHQGMMNAVGLAYVDTDSLHCAKALVKQGEALGEWKCARQGARGKFYAPKVYELEIGKEKVFKSKGFPVKEAEFRKAVSLEGVERERFELMKRPGAGGAVMRKVDFKQWSGRSMKRAPLWDGGTRPWDVTELQAGKHLKARCPLLPGAAEDWRRAG